VRKGTDTALPTVRLARRIGRLEEGARENAMLAVALERQVAQLEQSLLPVLEALARRGASGDEGRGRG
jgi:hypothetical protein